MLSSDKLNIPEVTRDGRYFWGMARRKSPIVGLAELAAMLGVSSQRADQITAKRGFPKPYAELASGRVWRLTAVEKWAAETGRELKEPDS